MKLSNIYDFYYKLSEEERIRLIGEKILEVRLFNGKTKNKESVRTYYVVGLNDRCFNYGVKQGLISLNPPLIMTLSENSLKNYLKHHGDPYWFKLGAFSPDDLDLSLEFLKSKNPEKDFRKVEAFMEEYGTTFIDTSYEEIFKFAQNHLGMGEIGL